MDDANPFPTWEEPATKGDVIAAMIWAQGVHGALFGLITAYRTNDPDIMKAAVDRYAAEHDQFNRKIDELAGRLSDGK